MICPGKEGKVEKIVERRSAVETYGCIYGTVHTVGKFRMNY